MISSEPLEITYTGPSAEEIASAIWANTPDFSYGDVADYTSLLQSVLENQTFLFGSAFFLAGIVLGCFLAYVIGGLASG